MKLTRFFCIIIVFLIGVTARSEADGHGGFHGGGGWRGGGGRGWRGGGFFGDGVVIATPGYYYGPYPYYYGDPYYYGASYGPPPYYGGESGAPPVAVAVQEELSRRGYYKGEIDGIVGAGTRAAISAYQRNHGLPMSGAIDSPLLRSLGL